LIANLMADCESGSPSSYSHFIVTIGLSRLVSEIFACDRQTDNSNHYYSWPPHCGGPANRVVMLCNRLKSWRYQTRCSTKIFCWHCRVSRITSAKTTTDRQLRRATEAEIYAVDSYVTPREPSTKRVIVAASSSGRKFDKKALQMHVFYAYLYLQSYMYWMHGS